MCLTDRHDMTLAVKVVLNPNTTNQPTHLHVQSSIFVKNIIRAGGSNKRPPVFNFL